MLISISLYKLTKQDQQLLEDKISVMVEHARLLQELVARCAVHDCAALQNDRLVGDLEDLMSMLFHDDPRETFFAKESVQCAEKFLDNNWGEPFGWLSSSRTFGLRTSARPIANICCSPPVS